MKFCVNCGQELAEGVRYCPMCGTPVQGSKSNEQRKTVYDGKIHKCPNCGEVLDSFTLKCPSCGYEMRDASNSDAIKGFAQRLEQTESKDKEIALIKSFPVPNTKEDILEFMILASTNILDESCHSVNKAWCIKFEQSYQKAKLLLENEDLLKIQELYTKTNKKIKSQNFVIFIKSIAKAIVKVGNLLPKMANLALKNLLGIFSVIAFLKAVQIDKIGNGSGYELLGGILLISASCLLMRKSVSYLDIAIVVLIGILTFYLAGFLKNGSALQLFGAIALFNTFIGFVRKMIMENINKGDGL